MLIPQLLTTILVSVVTVVGAKAPTVAPPYSMYTNPYDNRDLYVPQVYKKHLDTTHASFMATHDAKNAQRITRLQKEGSTFIWINSFAAIDDFAAEVDAASNEEHAEGVHGLVQFVVYNIPDRDCTSTSPTGELTLASNGAARYESFLANITAIISSPSYRHLTFAVILEPSLMSNTLQSVRDQHPRCAGAAEQQHTLLSTALRAFMDVQRQGVNVAIYIDLANSLTLGKNRADFDEVLYYLQGVIYGSHFEAQSRVRGVALNVGGYNPLSAGEEKDVAYADDATVWSEGMFIDALLPSMHTYYLDFMGNFLVDQGLAGKGGLREEGEKGCNVKGAGMGVRPGKVQGVKHVDSAVWVGQPGVSQGTCGGGPEEGAWWDEYARELVKNAVPEIEPLV